MRGILEKGRPYRIYKLNCSLPDIVPYLESENVKEADKVMKQIEKLRAITKVYFLLIK